VFEEVCQFLPLHLRQVGGILHNGRPEEGRNSRTRRQEVQVEEVLQDDETSDGSDVHGGDESDDYLGDGVGDEDDVPPISAEGEEESYTLLCLLKTISSV